MSASQTVCPSCGMPLDKTGIDGQVGGYVVEALSEVGCEDLEHLTYEFIKRATGNIDIKAKEYKSDPKRYVAGYLSWLRNNEFIRCPPNV